MKRTALSISIVFAANFLAAQWLQHPQFGGYPYDKQNTDVFFADENNGWLVEGHDGYFSYRTTDGGNNWEIMDDPEIWIKNCVFFSDPNNGWAIGDNAIIVHTDNGGIDWIEQESGIEDHDLNSVFFVDSLKGWAVGGYIGACFSLHSVIIATSDGGNTWEVQSENGEGIFSDVFFTNDMVGWAVVGFSGDEFLSNILFTDNGGNTWLEISDSCRGGHSIYFLDDDTGFIAGGDINQGNIGWILKTIDGGYSWSTILKDTIPILMDIVFTDSLNGYAVGYSGSILNTHDGGETWSYRESGTSAKLNSICFTDENHGWICGDSNIVLYTENAGIVREKEITYEQKTLTVYPNPCKDYIHLMLDGSMFGEVEYEIINLQGTIIKLSNYPNPQSAFTIDMSGLPGGIYIIRVFTNRGSFTRKAIKSK